MDAKKRGEKAHANREPKEAQRPKEEAAKRPGKDDLHEQREHGQRAAGAVRPRRSAASEAGRPR